MVHMDPCGGMGGKPWYAPIKVESLKTLGLIYVYVVRELSRVERTLSNLPFHQASSSC